MGRLRCGALFPKAIFTRPTGKFHFRSFMSFRKLFWQVWDFSGFQIVFLMCWFKFEETFHVKICRDLLKPFASLSNIQSHALVSLFSRSSANPRSERVTIPSEYVLLHSVCCGYYNGKHRKRHRCRVLIVRKSICLKHIIIYIQKEEKK